MGELEGVTQIVCDRHDVEKLNRVLPEGIRFDAVIDFCGYHEGEIRSILQIMGERAGQYIFISTSSVYDASIQRPKNENDRIRISIGGSFVDEYIAEKAALEKECIAGCAWYRIPYTILRPAFLYGPLNYAPRESYYIEKIVKHEKVPVVTDSNSRFSFCYVKDLAEALQLCAGNPVSYGEIFNVASYEEITYDLLISTLEEAGGIPFEKEEYTVGEVISKKLPLPYPLDTNDLVDGSRISGVLGLNYTLFRDGMIKTFNAFRKVFEKR